MSQKIDPEILREVQQGNRQILAKAITQIENSNQKFEVPDLTSSIQVLGVTGAPGVGKSTTVNCLVKYLRQKIYQLQF